MKFLNDVPGKCEVPSISEKISQIPNLVKWTFVGAMRKNSMFQYAFEGHLQSVPEVPRADILNFKKM